MDDRLPRMFIVASNNSRETMADLGQMHYSNDKFLPRVRDVKEAAMYAVGVMDAVAALLQEDSPYEEPDMGGNNAVRHTAAEALADRVAQEAAE